MKVDLTARDIELILLLLSDAISSDAKIHKSSTLMTEELALVTKLENMLAKYIVTESEVLDIETGEVYH